MKKLTGFAMVLGFLVTVLYLAHPPFAQANVIELNYSIFFPATHANTILAQAWSDEINKRTNGAVKITIFPGGTLTPADKCYDGVVKGLSDIGFSVLGYTKGRFPLTEVMDLPIGHKTGLQSTKVINAYYKKFQPKEFDDVKVMYLHTHGPGLFHTKKQVEKLDDLKGLKIRCHGTSKSIVESLGAVPVGMPMPETYDALQKGIAEGVCCPLESLKGWKLGEVVKFSTLNFGSAYTTSFFVVMNKEKWNSLPKDVQATIEKINEEYIEKQGKTWDDIDKIGVEFAQSQGGKMIQLSKEEDAKWAELVKPILADYIKDKKAKGLPAEEALKFCVDELKK